jgi:hypothetical protein
MTPKDDFIGQLDSYLDGYEGSTPLPEGVRDAIRAELPSIHQRPAWWPARRPPTMNNTAKLTLAAAAVVVAALLGYRFLVPGTGSGGPGPTAAPTPEPQALLQGSEGPGFFTTEFFTESQAIDPVQFTFEMPADWGAAQPWVIGPTRDGPGAGIAFVQVSGLYSDPCLDNVGSPDVEVGSTAAELASALTDQTAYAASATAEFTVDGYDGVRMELQTPSELDYTTCQGGQFWVWPEPFYEEDPSRWDLWILDLDGTTAVVLAEVGDASADDLDRIEGLVQSIQIQP